METIQDEFGEYRWIDHEGRMHNGTPEPDTSARMVFVASMMHAHLHRPVLDEKPNVTCPNDAVDSDRRNEVAQNGEVPGVPKHKKNLDDKKSTFTIKAKSIPVTPKTVAASTWSVRERWLISIYKEIENFLLNMAITDAHPSLVVKFKSMGKWPLPCHMVFVPKPLTQAQQSEVASDEACKHKSRLVICGNLWGEHSTTSTNLDAPLLRLMLSLATAQETTWSSVDVTSAFLNADTHEDDTVLVTPPPILVNCTNIVKPNTVWRVKKVIYGLREAPRLWQGERDQHLRDLELVYQDRPAHLVQSHIHPSLWLTVEGSLAQHHVASTL